MGFANASFEMRGAATFYIGEEEAGREEETPHFAPTWEPPAMYDMQDVIFRLQCLQEEFLDASGKDQMQWSNAKANPGMAPEFLEVGLSVRAVATFVTPGNVTVQAEERGAVIHVRDNEGAAMIQFKLAGCRHNSMDGSKFADGI